MTDKKISELTAITGANTALDDLFLIVDVSANQTKKITRQELNNATATNFYNTSTQTATDTATLTADQITGPFLIGAPTATASYTLPLASAVDTALGTPANETGFEFVVFTTAAFAITLLTNTGWTLVGSMATGATANSFARFRVRKTGTAAYSIYRVS